MKKMLVCMCSWMIFVPGWLYCYFPFSGSGRRLSVSADDATPVPVARSNLQGITRGITSGRHFVCRPRLLYLFPILMCYHASFQQRHHENIKLCYVEFRLMNYEQMWVNNTHYSIDQVLCLRVWCGPTSPPELTASACPISAQDHGVLRVFDWHLHYGLQLR